MSVDKIVPLAYRLIEEGKTSGTRTKCEDAESIKNIIIDKIKQGKKVNESIEIQDEESCKNLCNNDARCKFLYINKKGFCILYKSCSSLKTSLYPAKLYQKTKGKLCCCYL